MHAHKQALVHACMHAHACTPACTHTHTLSHTVQSNNGAGQCCLVKIFREEKYPEFAFEGRESSLMSWGRLFQLQGQFSVCSHKCVCLLVLHR